MKSYDIPRFSLISPVCVCFFPIVSLDFPPQNLRTSRPWPMFTGFLSYCGAILQLIITVIIELGSVCILIHVSCYDLRTGALHRGHTIVLAQRAWSRCLMLITLAGGTLVLARRAWSRCLAVIIALVAISAGGTLVLAQRAWSRCLAATLQDRIS